MEEFFEGFFTLKAMALNYYFDTYRDGISGTALWYCTMKMSLAVIGQCTATILHHYPK